MNKFPKRALISFFTVLSIAFLLGSTPSVKLRDVCAYDKFCKSLTVDGQLKEPDQALLSLLKKYRSEIAKYAKQYQVDPRAIVGAVLAENTLNVGKTDEIQNFLVNIGAAKDGRFLGKSFSYGLGQIKCERASEVDSYYAKLEKRKSNSNICEEIRTGSGSFKVIAMALRQAINLYKDNGMDISGNIGVQTTLYNLGRVEERARKAKEEKRLPRINYFGWFVESNNEDIISVTGAPDAAVVAKTAVPAKKAKAGTTGDTNEKSAATGADGVGADIEVNAPIKMRPSFSKPANLSSAPPQCVEKTKSNERNPYLVAGSVAVKNGKYSVIGTAIDCGMAAWSLVRTDSGQVGWIKASELKSKSTQVPSAGALQCEEKDTECARVIRKSEAANLIDVDDEMGTIDLQISSKNGGNSARAKIATSDYSALCMANPFDKYGRPRRQIAELKDPTNPIVFTASDEKEIRGLVLAKVKSLGSVEGPKFALPFFDLFNCKENCVGDKNDISEYIKKWDPENPIKPPSPSVRIPSKVENGILVSELKKQIEACNSGPSRKITEKLDQSIRNTLLSENTKIRRSALQSVFNLRRLQNSLDSYYGPQEGESNRSLDNLEVNSELIPGINRSLLICNTKIPDPRAATEAQGECPECLAQEKAFVAGLKAILGDAADLLYQRDLLLEFGKAVVSDCAYDVEETSQRISKLINNACVKRVYVPDAFTFELFKQIAPEKVVLRQFPKKNKFTVEIDSKCSEIETK